MNVEKQWKKLLNAKFDCLRKVVNDSNNWYSILGVVRIPLGELVRLNPNLLQ